MDLLDLLFDLINTKSIEIILAGFLAYIAWQNHVTSKNELKFKLFEKRYAIFQVLQNFLKTFLGTGLATRENIFESKIKCSTAFTMFEKEVQLYIDEVFEKALKHIHLKSKLSQEPSPSHEERVEIAKEMEELESWFTDQIQESKNTFQKYLDFSTLK